MYYFSFFTIIKSLNSLSGKIKLANANADFIIINKQSKFDLCTIKANGIIKHIWMTLASSDNFQLTESFKIKNPLNRK